MPGGLAEQYERRAFDAWYDQLARPVSPFASWSDRVSHRKCAVRAANGSNDTVWAAREAEQNKRNERRALIFSARYHDHMRAIG